MTVAYYENSGNDRSMQQFAQTVASCFIMISEISFFTYRSDFSRLVSLDIFLETLHNKSNASATEDRKRKESVYMDYNQNSQNPQNQNNEWDRWNSGASSSSYYNQPTHTPYDQGFSIASLVLGLLSTTLGCCGISLPLGALGILFAILCYRRGKHLNSNARFGLCLSVFGCIYGIGIMIYTLFVQLPAMLQDPAYTSQLNQLYQMLFGMDFQEFIQSFYGIGL